MAKAKVKVDAVAKTNLYDCSRATRQEWTRNWTHKYRRLESPSAHDNAISYRTEEILADLLKKTDGLTKRVKAQEKVINDLSLKVAKLEKPAK